MDEDKKEVKAHLHINVHAIQHFGSTYVLLKCIFLQIRSHLLFLSMPLADLKYYLCLQDKKDTKASPSVKSQPVKASGEESIEAD